MAIHTLHDGTIPGSYAPACRGGGPPRPAGGAFPEVAGPDDEVLAMLDEAEEEARAARVSKSLPQLPEDLAPLTGDPRTGTLVRFGRSSLAHILARASVSHGSVLVSSLCGEVSRAETATREGMSTAWPCRECVSIAEAALAAMPFRGGPS